MKSYRKDYPRPQHVRKDWTNLNGEWDFLFDDQNCGESEKWFADFPEERMQIQVPFTYETKCSGIQDEKHHENIWYSRQIMIGEADLNEKNVMLHFEGSDFVTKVWVNGIFVGQHRGGYARFSFDITKEVVIGENTITVKVEDSPSMEQPRGKQRWKGENYGCWYVQTTGIWKTVWMESVSKTHLERMKITPDMNAGAVELLYNIEGTITDGEYSIETEIEFENTRINKSVKVVQRNSVAETVSVFCPEEMEWAVHSWSPAHPELYDLKITLYKDGKPIDQVLSYFGMRDIAIKDGKILLNGHPIYQRLILDQGYWEDSHLTPPSEEALIEDLDKILAMGYNGLRKHMKIEDERFLYWCDVKGVLMWSEMAASYAYSDSAVQEFTKEWMEVVRQNYNHPAIITWTPFNESWGVPKIFSDKQQQHFTESIYHLTKSFDAMRPVIVNDGWENTISDILTLHDYEEDGDVFMERYGDAFSQIEKGEFFHNYTHAAFANGYGYKGQPIIISEYGGIAFSGGAEDSWGYGNTVADETAFLKRFDKITSAIRQLPYCVGYCYTQVSDVQQEVNGLLDARHEYKIAPEKIAELNLKETGIHKNYIC